MTPLQAIRIFTERASRSVRPTPAPAAPTPKSKYTQAGVEPPLAEVLEDPVVRLLMRADRLDPTEIQRSFLTAQYEQAG